MFHDITNSLNESQQLLGRAIGLNDRQYKKTRVNLQTKFMFTLYIIFYKYK